MIVTQLKPLLISLLLIIGNFSQYDTNKIIKSENFPKVIIVQDRIEAFCGSKEHLGCYSGSKNMLIIKQLRSHNHFDLAILMHELFHHVQWQSLKWHQKSPQLLEKESYAFEYKFYHLLKTGEITLKVEGISEELLVSNSFIQKPEKHSPSRFTPK